MTSGNSPERTPLLGLNRRARWLLPIFLLLLVGLTFRHLLFPDPHSIATFSGATMGTTWSVKLATAELDSASRKRVLSEIDDELQLVNKLMSTWDENSELSRLNRSNGAQPFPLSQPNVEVFALAAQISELSGGAFDVTVGPLVSAWGFGADRAVTGSPSEQEVSELEQRVGYQKLDLDAKRGTITKKNPAIHADLSAIAKGYAVDRVSAALQRLGYRNFLVEIGGELKAHGQKLPDRDWRVAVERPDELSRSIYAVVQLRDLGMATSGDYRSFILEDGTRRSHLIDPRKGRPVMHALASVSVVDLSTARADALATALGVMGAEEGFALAERAGIAAYFIVREAQGEFRARSTTAFAPLLVSVPPVAAP